MEHQQLPGRLSDDPQRIVMSHCSEFLADIASYTSGNSTHPKLFETLKCRFQELKAKLENTRPTLDGKHIQYRNSEASHSDVESRSTSACSGF